MNTLLNLLSVNLMFMEQCIARCVFYITNEMQLIQCRQQESMTIPKAAHTVL